MPIALFGARSDETMFRAGTGVFAVLLIAHRRRDRRRALRQSQLSIKQFGWQFWQTDLWDPVLGEFGARPFIWGTLYSSVLALMISTPIALGIAIYISELAPTWLRRPLVFLTELLAAIPSIVYGLWGVFVLVPVRPAAAGRHARLAEERAALHRPAARRRHALGRADPRHHGDPVHVLGRARSAEGGAAGAARRRVRARRDAVGSDPHGALLRPHRHRRRRDARIRPRARRDDGGDDGDRQQPADQLVAVRAAVHDGRRASPTSSPRRPTISICTRSSRSASCCSSSRSSST